jgi:uncharacterized membrane protein
MATTASKPRSAQAAANEAASVTRATAARRRSAGNASNERVAKEAQARRSGRTAASSRSSAGSSSGRATQAKSGSGSGRSSQAKSGSGNGRPSQAKSGSGNGRSSQAKSGSGNGASTSQGRAQKPKTNPAKVAKATASRAASKTASRAKDEVKDDGKQLASALFSSTSPRGRKHPVARGVAKRAARKTLRAVGRRSLSAGGGALRTVAENAGQALRAGMSRVVENRPPIQASVDVAAPISVVWSEWLTFDWFTEGLHNLQEVERDGDELFGRVVAPHERDWHAEIVDEREQQAFAWRSDDGTDCAGLVTFHRLSERLTRVEADLDVLPTNPGEAFLLSLPIPARRAERELQLFKAHVEFINPDVYEEDEDSGGSESDDPDDARTDSDDPDDARVDSDEAGSQAPEDNEGAREDADNDDY